MKSLFGYIFCIAVAILMAVMIDGRGGVLIALTLIIGLLVSVIYQKWFTKKVSLEISTKHNLLAKGDIIEVKLTLTKLSRLPSPIFETDLKCSGQISAIDGTGRRFSLTPGQRTRTVTIELKADYSGKAFIELERFEIVDFLGFTHFIVPFDREKLRLDLKIMPKVPDTGTQLEVIRTVTDNIGFDDSEDETSETAMGSTGTPGYDHRNYVPGDPLKKINWKLSSKRGIYMVRLDERLAVTSQVFILDLPMLSDMSQYSYKRADIIIEGALAMLSMLSQQGLETDMYFFTEGSWHCFPVKALGDVYSLAELLADNQPYISEHRIPPEALKHGTALCFTSIRAEDQALSAELSSFGGLVFIVSQDSGFRAGSGDIWTCSEEFEFKHLN